MNTLCIDLGGSRVKLAIVDEGRVNALEIFAMDNHRSMREVLTEIEAHARRLEALDSCRGLGFAYPGIVDPWNSRVVTSNEKYMDAPEIDFERWARERFSLEIALSNDAAAAICGEMAYGAGRGCADAVMLMVGTGIGTAAYSGGRVLLGRHGTMGILGGHIAIAHERPRRCTCGNLGCLEAYAGTWALDGIAREDPGFAQSCLSGASRIDYRSVIEGCEAGDAVCQRVFAGASAALGTGAVNLIHAYDPELLILSGGAAHIGALREAVQAHIDRHSWTPWGRVRVVTAENPEASVLLGLCKLFEDKKKGDRP